MKYRALGRTGVKVSPLCLGCGRLGGEAGERASIEIIERAIDAGINFLDTHSHRQGVSEEIVGQALKCGGHRNRTVLATKLHFRVSSDRPNTAIRRHHIKAQCEASLNRLQTDWIDLYQIHEPTSDIPIDETLRALDDLIREGKVRYIGSSTLAAWQLIDSLWTSREKSLNQIVSDQPPYHLLDRRIERELIPMALTYGLAVLPWSPLADGFLTGKYGRGRPPPANARLATTARDERIEAVFSDASHTVVETLSLLAREKGCTASQLALAWCMQQPGITCPIIGPRTIDQLDDNLGSLHVSISDRDLKMLDEVAPPGGMIAPYYEADFGPHRFGR